MSVYTSTNNSSWPHADVGAWSPPHAQPQHAQHGGGYAPQPAAGALPQGRRPLWPRGAPSPPAAGTWILWQALHAQHISLKLSGACLTQGQVPYLHCSCACTSCEQPQQACCASPALGTLTATPCRVQHPTLCVAHLSPPCRLELQVLFSTCRPTAQAPSIQGCPAAASSLPQGCTSEGPGLMTTAALWTGETLMALIVTPAAAAAMGRLTQGAGGPLLGWA